MTDVTVLGAGALGGAMARRLADQGLDVRLWNRTPAKADEVADGVERLRSVDDLAEAVRGADILVTVLRDGEAVADTVSRVLGDIGEAVWVQASTVGPDWTDRLRGLADAAGIAFLDAPVSGSTGPAASGSLVWLVAGDDHAVDRAEPALDALGSRVIRVGNGSEASALKLVVNVWMSAAVVALSDTYELCDRLGVDHPAFLEALDAGPLRMAYADQKAELMDQQSYEPGFSVGNALKDVDLAIANGGDASPLVQAVRDRLAATAAMGHEDDDIAAVDALRVDRDPDDDRRDED